MLEGVAVRSHVGTKAAVEFTSHWDEFTLRRGVRLVLSQVDPERVPLTFAKTPILEVRSPAR